MSLPSPSCHPVSTPSEATFSRAFAEFAAANLPHILHQTLVRITLADRHFDYIARDSTAIEARERLPQDLDSHAD